MIFCKVFSYFLEIRCDDAGIINYYLLFIYLLVGVSLLPKIEVTWSARVYARTAEYPALPSSVMCAVVPCTVQGVRRLPHSSIVFS